MHARHLALAVLAALLLASCAGESTGGADGFCDTHECIPSFSEGTGSIVQCADGMWSHSGGRPGACSHHGGVRENAASTGPSAAASPEPLETVSEPAGPSVAALMSSAEQLVRNFYADLNLRDFAAAWDRLTPAARAALGPYDTWRRGYDQTLSSEPGGLVAMVSGNASTVRFTLRATDLDACARHVRQRFAMTWWLTRAGGRWRLGRADSSKITGHPPANKVADCSAPPDDVDVPEDLDVPDDVEDPCITSCDSGGPRGNGYAVRCADGEISHSGGIQGACSHHGGLAGGGSSPRTTVPDDDLSSPSGTVHVDGYYRKDGTYVAPYTRRAPRP